MRNFNGYQPEWGWNGCVSNEGYYDCCCNCCCECCREEQGAGGIGSGAFGKAHRNKLTPPVLPQGNIKGFEGAASTSPDIKFCKEEGYVYLQPGYYYVTYNVTGTETASPFNKVFTALTLNGEVVPGSEAYQNVVDFPTPSLTFEPQAAALSASTIINVKCPNAILKLINNNAVATGDFTIYGLLGITIIKISDHRRGPCCPLC